MKKLLIGLLLLTSLTLSAETWCAITKQGTLFCNFYSAINCYNYIYSMPEYFTGCIKSLYR